MEVVITRSAGDERGTPGLLQAETLQLLTLELGWRENGEHMLSCIPAGKYRLYWALSPHLGRECYHVGGVLDNKGQPREGILIHSGNWAGATDQGYVSDVLGCILVGLDADWAMGLGCAKAQRHITQSKAALAKLETLLGKKDHELTIVWL